jgi:hypothetical protein
MEQNNKDVIRDHSLIWSPLPRANIGKNMLVYVLQTPQQCQELAKDKMLREHAIKKQPILQSQTQYCLRVRKF